MPDLRDEAWTIYSGVGIFVLSPKKNGADIYDKIRATRVKECLP